MITSTANTGNKTKGLSVILAETKTSSGAPLTLRTATVEDLNQLVRLLVDANDNFSYFMNEQEIVREKILERGVSIVGEIKMMTQEHGKEYTPSREEGSTPFLHAELISVIHAMQIYISDEFTIPSFLLTYSSVRSGYRHMGINETARAVMLDYLFRLHPNVVVFSQKVMDSEEGTRKYLESMSKFGFVTLYTNRGRSIPYPGFSGEVYEQERREAAIQIAATATGLVPGRLSEVVAKSLPMVVENSFHALLHGEKRGEYGSIKGGGALLGLKGLTVTATWREAFEETRQNRDVSVWLRL